MPPNSKSSHGVVRPGDKVAFCASCFLPGRQPIVCGVLQDLNLVPLVYEGIRDWVAYSSLHSELSDDFYNARLRIIFLDFELDGAMATNWALDEIRHVGADSVLIYSSKALTQEETLRLRLPGTPIVARDFNELKQDLRTRVGAMVRQGTSP